MGRESRRPRKEHLDRGDAGRLVMAHGTCNQLLAADLRIGEHYRAWVTRQEQHRRDGPPDWVHTEAHADQLMATIREGEIDGLATALREMGVPWRWCASALILHYFPAMRHNERHPESPKVVKVSAGIKGLPAGRAPRHQGNDVAEWVRWWYRHKVKQPSDSIYELAQEYAEREKRHTRADSVVDDGIQRAETLLNRVIAPEGGPPTL